jgi:cytosine deaminase
MIAFKTDHVVDGYTLVTSLLTTDNMSAIAGMCSGTVVTLDGNMVQLTEVKPLAWTSKMWFALKFRSLGPTGPSLGSNIDYAIHQAYKSLAEGGIPIGAALEMDGEIISMGHNRRVQDASAVLHAEMDCLENAGRLTAKEYAQCTLYTTLAPCAMCSGAILLYGIKKIIVGENSNYKGEIVYLRSRGCNVTILDSKKCYNILYNFIMMNKELWHEDIGLTRDLASPLSGSFQETNR